MHICFAAIDYHGTTAGGGIASYVDTVGKALVARGHRVTVIAKGHRRTVAPGAGLRVVYAPLGNIHWYFHRLHAPSIGILPVRELEWSYGLLRAVQEIADADPIDVIESYETGVLFLSGHHRHVPPLVIRLHGDQYTFARHSGDQISSGLRLDHKLQLRAWKRAAALTAPSRFHAREVSRDLEMPASAIDVIPNPVSPWMLEKADAITGGADDRRPKDMVLYTGRIERRKGVLPLLRSVGVTAGSVPDVRYTIAGARHSSVSERELERTLNDDLAGKRVRILGHVPWQDLPSLYATASVFVMPSFYETFGISVIEAMAFGLPVVATEAGALPEVVESGVTGILVPPGDPQALGEAVASLLKDTGRARRMGAAGRERVRAEFTVDQVTERSLAVYERAQTTPPMRSVPSKK